MPDPVPVLVVHGVANHERDPFLKTVDALQQHFVGELRLIPVFWGDLGGKSQDITDTLPPLHPAATRSVTRSAASGADARPVTPSPDVDAAADTILRGAGRSAGAGARRSGASDPLAEAVKEALPQTRYLQHLRDPELLESVGRILEEASGPPASAETPASGGFRGGVGETRGFVGDLFGGAKDRLKRVLGEVDSLLGRSLENALGNLNEGLRDSIAVPFANFFGDIFAYHNDKDRIQARLWEALRDNGLEGHGHEDKPVNVMAHSLGGVVTLDAATHPDPAKRLWIKELVSFGSQSSMFQVLVPREGLTPYAKGSPIRLPPSIGAWTNLWGPMDFLAFGAGTVYRLSGGAVPQDSQVSYTFGELQEIGWLNTHGGYWVSEELVDTMRARFLP